MEARDLPRRGGYDWRRSVTRKDPGAYIPKTLLAPPLFVLSPYLLPCAHIDSSNDDEQRREKSCLMGQPEALEVLREFTLTQHEHILDAGISEPARDEREQDIDHETAADHKKSDLEPPLGVIGQ